MRKSSLKPYQTVLPVAFSAAALLLAGCGKSADPEAGTVVIQPVTMATLEPQSAYAIERDFAGLVVPAGDAGGLFPDHLPLPAVVRETSA